MASLPPGLRPVRVQPGTASPSDALANPSEMFAKLKPYIGPIVVAIVFIEVYPRVKSWIMGMVSGGK